MTVMGVKEPQERTSFRMSRIGQKDTNIERVVRSRLQRDGLRFRKNVQTLPGTPDVVFPRQRLAVFIDGDFWHGYDFVRWRNRVSQYWVDKITRNIQRDQRNASQLEELGWRVVRVWGHEVDHDLDGVIRRIKDILKAT